MKLKIGALVRDQDKRNKTGTWVFLGRVSESPVWFCHDGKISAGYSSDGEDLVDKGYDVIDE